MLLKTTSKEVAAKEPDQHAGEGTVLTAQSPQLANMSGKTSQLYASKHNYPSA